MMRQIDRVSPVNIRFAPNELLAGREADAKGRATSPLSCA